MIKSPEKKFVPYFFIDFILIALIFYLSYIFRFNSFNNIFTQAFLPDIKEYSIIFLLWAITITVFFKRKELYSADRKLTIPGEILRVVISVFYASILIAAVIFFLKYKFFSRKVFLESLFLLCVFLSGWRAGIELIIRRLVAGKLHCLEIFLIGAGNIGRTIKRLILDRIDRIIRLFLYLLISVLPFSKAGVEICFVVILSLWIIKRLFLKSFWPEKSMLNGPILVYIFIGIFSVLGSAYFKVSLHAFFTKFMEGLLLYFIIIEVIKQKRQVSIIIGLLLSATVVVCIDGIIQGIFTGADIFRQMPIVKEGVTAAFNHKNDLGGYLLIPLPIVLALILKRLYILKRNWRAVSNKSILATLIVLSCLFTITVALTNSRGAWIALVLGILIPYFFISKKFVIGIVVSGCLLLVLSIFYTIYTQAESLSMDLDISRDTIPRVEIWKDALKAIKERPVFGHGINTYMRTFAQRYKDTGPTYAHNCYLQIGAEMGIAGLFCFLWIIRRLFRTGLRLVLNHYPGDEDDRPLRFLLIGLLCGLLAFLVHSFVDTNLYSLQLNALFWYMMGVAVSIMRLLRPASEGRR